MFTQELRNPHYAGGEARNCHFQRLLYGQRSRQDTHAECKFLAFQTAFALSGIALSCLSLSVVGKEARR